MQTPLLEMLKDTASIDLSRQAAAEIERLRAALRRIEGYPSLVPSEEHYKQFGGERFPDFRQIARDALKNEYAAPFLSDDVTRAVATLIAAAPDLLHALEQLLDDMSPDGLSVCQQAKDQALAAYKKATGQDFTV